MNNSLLTENHIDSSNIEAFINDLFSLQKTGKYVFRGICNDKEFLPSLFRYYDDNEIEKTGMNLTSYEFWLLNEYGKYSTTISS